MDAESEKETVTMVIDCDAGVDDATAIMMALCQTHVQLLAITCVSGNVALDKVSINVLRVLQICGRMDVPVYPGASKDILGTAPSQSTDHGSDGLGDIPNLEAPPSAELLQSEHAANALIRLANEHHRKITLVAIGPLTNVALAMRLDDGFTSKLKELVIMGGNILGTGTRFPASEFNFTVDPTAAHIVVTETQCPTILVPLETCLSHHLSYDWYDGLCQNDSPKAAFLSAILASSVRRSKSTNRPGCAIPDGCAIVLATCRAAIEKAVHTPCLVEVHEGMTKGQMVTSKIFRPWIESFPGPEINVVLEFDITTYYSILDKVVR